MTKRKILWHSVAPWAPTGYGVQTALFAPRIAALPDVDLAISAYWGLGGSALDWRGIKVYPSDEDRGNRFLPWWLKRHAGDEPCQVIMLTDAWTLNLDMLRSLESAAVWVPVDHKPTPPMILERFTHTPTRAIAMSKFGHDQLLDEGIANALYVPHGVDTEAFQQVDRKAAREALRVPEDAFVVGMVANNQGTAPPRKAFPQAFLAFSEIRRRHPDAILYLHAEATGFKNGCDLFEILGNMEVPADAVRMTNPADLELGIDPRTMAVVYSAMDVLLNPSYGEGFGVPIIEAQACGTPVIVTDWTSMPELCGAGWLVGGEPFYDPHQHAWFRCPAVDQIVEALEAAYDSAETMRLQARDFALGYDADKIMHEHWISALDELRRPREVPPLARKPNRAERRAATKKQKVCAA